MTRPDAAIDLVIASPARFAATVSSRHCVALGLVTLLVAATFAIPFGLFFGANKAMHVGALFVGSVLVCYPSFHVFTAYVGIALRVEQSAALAILTAAVASTFSLGFAPIVFFLRATIVEAAADETMAPIVGTLLATSSLAGMLQVVRCVRSGTLSSKRGSFGFVLLGWFVLLSFITMRMARVLGLAG